MILKIPGVPHSFPTPASSEAQCKPRPRLGLEIVLRAIVQEQGPLVEHKVQL